MSYQFEVHFKVLWGLGPRTVTRTITIFYDDVDPDTPEEIVKSQAISDAKTIMFNRTEAGYPMPEFEGIYAS